MKDYFRKKTWLILAVLLVVGLGISFLIVNYEFRDMKGAQAQTIDGTVIRQSCDGFTPYDDFNYCYTSLKDWQNFRQRDLQSQGQIELVEIQGTWTSPDILPVTISGWDTDASHYIEIYTVGEARHNGIYGDKASAYRFEISATGQDKGIIINEEYIRIDGLQIKMENNGNSNVKGISIDDVNSPSNIHISNNIIQGINSGSSAQYFKGIASNDSDATMYVWNNIIYGFRVSFAGPQFGLGLWLGGTNYLYNNTISDCNRGVYTTLGAGKYLKNNAVFNNDDDFDGSFTEIKFNASDDGDGDDAFDISPVGCGTEAQCWDDAFIDYSNGDFHIQSDSILRDVGVNLASTLPFFPDVGSYDIDGDERPTSGGNIWDIGADEWGCAVTTEVVSVILPICGATPNCYESLSAWEDGEDRDLVAACEIAIARIEGNWSSGPDVPPILTDPVTIDDWTTDEDHYIKIYTYGEARHNGIYGNKASAYRLESNSGYLGVIEIKERYVQIDGLQINNTAHREDKNPKGILINAFNTDLSDIKISNNIIRSGGAGAANSNVNGIRVGGNTVSSVNVKIWNNIIYGGFWAGIWGGYGDTGNDALIYTHFIYNNTIHGCDGTVGTNGPVGIFENPNDDRSNVRLYNNLVQNTTNDKDYHFQNEFPSVSGSNNLSEDTTANYWGIGSQGTASFVNTTPGSEDFHLDGSADDAKDQGANLVTFFDDDIDGQTRSRGLAWDIGADEEGIGAESICEYNYHNVCGWAWNSDFGWLSFNCENEGTCGANNYGVDIDEETGNFSGFAWSNNIGWIALEEVGTCEGDSSIICVTSDDFNYEGETSNGLFKPQVIDTFNDHVYIANFGDSSHDSEIIVYDEDYQITDTYADPTKMKYPWDMIVKDGYIYIASASTYGLTVLTADPNDIQYVDHYSDNTNLNFPRHVFAADNKAYLTCMNDYLAMFDVGPSIIPLHIFDYGDENILDSPSGIFVEGDYAYVLGQNSNSLVVFAINNDQFEYSDSYVGGILNSPWDIYVKDGYAYVASGNDCLAVFDISTNPGNIIEVGCATDNGWINQPWAIDVFGKYAYVSTRSNPNRIVVFDILDPLDVQAVGYANTDDPMDISATEDLVYVNTQTPSYKLSYFSNSECAPDGGACVGDRPPDESYNNNFCKDNGCDDSSDCTACYNGGSVYGWAKAIALGNDGWTRLDDHNGSGVMPDYGVSLDMETCGGVADFEGWSWDGNVIGGIGMGWTSFNCKDYQTCQGGADDGLACSGSNCAGGTCLNTCTNYSNYKVQADVNCPPDAINLTAPNWNEVNACSMGALRAILRWEFIDIDDGAYGRAYQIKVMDAENGDAIILNSGKCNQDQECEEDCGQNGDNSKCKIDPDDCMYESGAQCSYQLDGADGIVYDRSYKWEVTVWDDYDAPSEIVQFDQDEGHTLTDNIDYNNSHSPAPKLTFTTYKHAFPVFPDPGFTYYLPDPSAAEHIRFDGAGSYYDVSGGPYDCRDILYMDNCGWQWNANPDNAGYLNPYNDPLPPPPAQSSSTIMIFTDRQYAQEIILELTDPDDYTCSYSESLNIKYQLPEWIEVK